MPALTTAMPSTLLLAVHCKKSDAIDIKTPVVKYVASMYGVQVRDHGAGVVLGRWGLGRA